MLRDGGWECREKRTESSNVLFSAGLFVPCQLAHLVSSAAHVAIRISHAKSQWSKFQVPVVKVPSPTLTPRVIFCAVLAPATFVGGQRHASIHRSKTAAIGRRP
jgi:hypothetical protein